MATDLTFPLTSVAPLLSANGLDAWPPAARVVPCGAWDAPVLSDAADVDAGDAEDANVSDSERNLVRADGALSCGVTAGVGALDERPKENPDDSYLNWAESDIAPIA